MTDKMTVAGSPWLPEYFGQEIFSTIHRLEESPHEKGFIWAGTDDGRLHLTRDGGTSWQEVTPPDLPELSGDLRDRNIATPIRQRRTSPLPGIERRMTTRHICYAAMTTAPAGRASMGHFPQDEISRTIREDTERQGLLYVRHRDRNICVV